MLWLGSGSLALAQQLPIPSNPNRPLEPPEIRQIIGFMIELDSTAAALRLKQAELDQEKAFELRQNDLAAKELDLQTKAAALAQHSADIEKDRADQYQALLKEATKKIGGGFGCHLKKLLTLGLGKCT